MSAETKRIKWEASGTIITESESPFREVCNMGFSEFTDVKDAEHAALIVRAVNCHDDLLKALKHCDEAFGKFCPDEESRYGMAWADVQAAIAKAEGRAE